MYTIEVLSVLQILIGAVLMLASIYVGMQIRKNIPPYLSKKWLLIIYFMCFFFVGYIFSVIVILSNIAFPLELVTGSVFLGGAFFVYIIIKLSRTSIQKIVEEESRFRKLSQEFNALLDAIPDNLTLQSHDLKVLWANRCAAGGSGREVSDLAGQYCYKLLHNRTAPCDSCPVLRSFRTGNMENEIVNSPDNRLWDMRTIPIKDEKGKVVNVIELGRDITEHRRLEAQLRQAQKMEAVGQLAGGIAHDFNNILTVITGCGEFLRERISKDDPLSVYVDPIITSSERAANLTQNLLAFSKRQIINLQPVKLKELVRRAERLLSWLISEDIELKTIFADEEITVMADSGQIEQVLMNLATNARDAMPDGGLLVIETETVELDDEFQKIHAYMKPGMYALISVTDTGVGIDEKTRKRIFEPFFTTKETGKGTGLGLSMVYGIIKQHNGYINAYSEVGKGTTFKIYLPLTKAAVKALEPADPSLVKGGTETVLVVEDDEAVRKLTRDILERSGYKIVEAKDGEDAVNKFIENKDRIQLLLLDVIMPKKSGKEVYAEIRSITPDIKVLFLSGYTANLIHKKGILEEGLNFILKPVSKNDLLLKVREALDK